MKDFSSVLFRRYLWLVCTIREAKYITYQEINDKWRNASINNDKEVSIPLRTFHRHKRAVEELFGISIRVRKLDNAYFIENEMDDDEVKRRMLSSFSLYNMLQEGCGMRDVVLFEPMPSGSEYLPSILNAIKARHTLKIEYKKFEDCESNTFEAEPYCLKFDKQRWYLLAKRTDQEIKKTYALDRVQDMEETEHPYHYPEDFSPTSYFEDSFGIFTNEDKPVEQLVIKVEGEASNYIRTLPLHPSQSEEKHSGYSIFSYNIKIDKELETELRKWGSAIEVLKPMSLRMEMKEEARRILEKYSNRCRVQFEEE